ncbi:MAG TPA: hypothetical protein PLH19_05550 [Anaerolineae bacterium]|nr:hypothetical protein [Anaerolineae bacterium]HQH37986.1 hypothetical protein [Anaerolineae bacterium]
MNSQIRIEVIDKEGWRKEFAFQKSLFHIGSAAVNDLVLESMRGGGVAARHAQLIAAPDGSGYRLVNLGDTDILLNEAGDKPVPPHSVASVRDGSMVKIGDFTLIFHGEAMMLTAVPTDGRSSHIGLRLSMPRTQLAPHQSLTGMLTVGNHGDQAGVQFTLELEGLDPDCYTIEPAPLLSSGSEREVALRLFHRGNKPLAGEHTLTIRATAPQAYPTEEATVRWTIQVQPFYQHTLRPVSTVNVPASPLEDLLPPTSATRPAARSTTPRPVTPPPVVTAQKPPAPWEEVPPAPGTPAEAAPAMPEKQQVRLLKAVSPSNVEAEPPKAAPAPSAAEDWWAGTEVPAVPAAVVEVEPAAMPATVAPEPDVVETLPPAPVEVATTPEVTTPDTAAVVAETAPTPAGDDGWGAPEKETPQPVVKITAPPQAEPVRSGEAEVKPSSQEENWWSEPEKTATPPTTNEDWWSA